MKAGRATLINGKWISLLPFAAIAVSLLIGCGPDQGASGGNEETTTIATQTSSGGVLYDWPNATVNGDFISPAPGLGYPCDPNSDVECVDNFAGTTNTLGTYTLYTNLMPADWEMSATEEVGTTDCQQGASWAGELTPGGGAQLVCGQMSSGSFVVSPASCYTQINDETHPPEVVADTCPTTITLTSSVTSMPTAYAMTVGTYDDSGASEASSSITATSPTSVTVPTPTTLGASAIVVVDGTTNTVIGAGLFTRSQEIESEPCGHQKQC